MKAEKKIRSRHIFYAKVLFIVCLVTGLAFLPTLYVVADQGQVGDGGQGHGQGVPNQTSLAVTKTMVVSINRGIELTIHKAAVPSEITLHQGATASVAYTIDVAGSLSDQTTYTVAGKIKAENTGDNPADVTAVWDVVEYKVNGGDWTPAGRQDIENPASPIPVKDSKYYDYNVVFTLPASVTPTAIRNTGYVKISNRGGENKDEPYHGGASLDKLPTPTVSQLPETVDVTDTETIDASGVSFNVDSVTWDGGSSSNPNGPWSVTLPNTITIKKIVSAAADATPRSYTLDNTASIIKGPSSSARVMITVPSPPSSPPSGGGGGGQAPPSGGGGGGSTTTTTSEQPSGGGGGGGEQAATTEVTQPAPAPAPAPEQAAVLPAVVTQPTPAPAAAQAKPKALPKKLPFTGVNFWYLSLAVLLMTVGLMLQLFRTPLPRHLRKAKW